ncbi:MAG: winged helix-turn-helix transcriptional regulator, partial [Clostridia bacterium]|nr:winged helix-turn-helix transcriptional regulator [Clostridia bacterium]
MIYTYYKTFIKVFIKLCLLARVEVNKLRFICALREKGRLSKKEMANICDLSIPTVNKIIRFYLQKKVVKESEFGQSSGGRRPILYEFNEKVKYVIGVDFEIPELTLVV